MRHVFLVITFIMLVVVVSVVYFMGVVRPEGLQQEFLKSCLSGQDGIKQYIAALKTKNETVCDNIKDKNVAVFCRAEVLNDQKLCTAIDFVQMRDYCTVIVTKEKEECGTNYQCMAYVTGEVSYCDKTDRINVNECKAVVQRDASLLTDICSDASYFMVSRLDKSLCKKIDDPVLKKECLM